MSYAFSADSAALIIEDEPIIANTIGSIVSGYVSHAIIVSTTSQADHVIQTRKIDFAILEPMSGDKCWVPVTNRLQKMSIPLLVVSSFNYANSIDRISDALFLEKPFSRKSMREVIIAVTASLGGFQVCG